ncbi:MAG: trypsin-like peptidase domain-containing protein, partial [Candidatus Heimdallarchaeota archaeon]|nr:trypsin-like peptidase domain-containing protein [Candidatus Heimdallarchaeota archaeon]
MINTKSASSIILIFVIVLILLIPSIAQDNAKYDNSKKYLRAVSEQYRAAAEKVRKSLVKISVDRYSEEMKYSPEIEEKLRNLAKTGGKFDMNVRPDMAVTGFIISEDRFIVTSAYNVSGRINGIEVTLADGRKFPARIAGINENHDVAVLQIDAKDLTVPIFADSDADAGTPIAAIASGTGNQLYFNSGTITGKLKLSIEFYFLDMLANFGNSGAPIINLDGEVLGMLNLISPKSVFGQNSGFGTCIPIETLVSDFTKLSQGLVSTIKPVPYLGVVFQPTTPNKTGLTIASVMPNTGAAYSGMKKGDELNRIN